jgi:hypothetical protein
LALRRYIALLAAAGLGTLGLGVAATTIAPLPVVAATKHTTHKPKTHKAPKKPAAAAAGFCAVLTTAELSNLMGAAPVRTQDTGNDSPGCTWYGSEPELYVELDVDTKATTSPTFFQGDNICGPHSPGLTDTVSGVGKVAYNCGGTELASEQGSIGVQLEVVSETPAPESTLATDVKLILQKLGG